MGRTSRRKPARQQAEAEVSDDEMERFAKQRTGDLSSDSESGGPATRASRGAKFEKLLVDSGDEDEDDDESAEEEVLGIEEDEEDEDEDEDDEEEEEEDEDDDEAAMEEAKAAKEIAKIGRDWGSKSDNYFKEGEESESEGPSDEEAADEEEKEEELEARRMRQQMLSTLRRDDLMDLGSDDEDGAKGKKGKKQPKKKKQKGSSAKNEELERVAAQAPELLSLLSEFKGSLAALEEHVAPVLKRVQEDEIATEHGISYLEAKYQAMLTYCINIAFYLYLKAQGGSVRDHPVIGELVRVRTVLEKLKPLDAKLKNQISELLTASTASAASNKKTRGAKLANGARPDPSALLADDESADEDEDEDPADADDLEDEDEDGQLKRRSRKAGARAYQAPRETFAPSSFQEDEREDERHRKRQAKMARKLKNSQMLQELTSEFSERPAEMPSIGATMEDAQNRKTAAERLRYEEENFVRLRETKKEKGERLRRERAAEQGLKHSMEELEDFGDLEGLVQRVDRDASRRVDSKARREQELERFMNRMNQKQEKSKAAKRGPSGDQDLKIRDPMVIQKMGGLDREGEEREEREERKRRRERAAALKSVEANTEVDLAEEDEVYRRAKVGSSARKRARQEKYKTPELMQTLEPAEVVDEGGARRATYKILKNVGLHAHKKKEDRNPRLKRRKKYEKQLKARKGAVQSMRTGEADTYGGEASGVRTNLVASRRPGK